MNNERLGKIEKSDRIELSLSNVSVGLLSRIKVNLEFSVALRQHAGLPHGSDDKESA